MLENLSVKKPFTILVGVILILVLGVISFINTSTDLLPEMELPYSAVITTYIGATPEQVERDVTIPLETRMSTLSGIEMVQSISNEHVSIVILQFAESTNMDSASLELREALDMLTLPDGVSKPMTIKVNPEMLPIMSAAVHMEGESIHELSELARNNISSALEGVPGVAVVSLSGLVQNQLHVIIDSERIEAVNTGLNRAVTEMMDAMVSEMIAQAEAMVTAQVEAYSESRMTELMMSGMSMEAAGAQLQMEIPAIVDATTEEVMEAFREQNSDREISPDTPIGLPAEMLSVETITGILSAQNFAMPAGIIVDDDDMEYMVRVGDRFENLDDIKNMLIFDPGMMGMAGLDPVRLSDIADIFETDNSHLSYTRVNGNPSVMLTIQRQSEYPTADVASAVRDRMDLLMEEHPGLGFAILMDQGEMVDMVINSVLNNLLFGGLLAILIIFLFLRDIRPTLIITVSIPVSLLLAFTLMYFTGISLNMMSMGGLALAVGMLVDNSIVVIENIYRMRSTTDRSAARAAISGVKQVSGALVAATVTTVVVFLPIVFTGGLARQLFVDFSLTIAYSLLASLIIAFTVVPASASTMLKNVKKEDYEGKLFTKFVNGYEAALRFSLRFKWAVILFAVAAFGFSFWAVYSRGLELIPNMEAPQITATADMPADSTFEETVAVAEAFSSRVLEINGVETVGVSVGGGGMMAMLGGGGLFGGMGGGGTTITMYLLLEEGRAISNIDLNTQIIEIGEQLGVEASVMGEDGGLSMLTGSPISVRVEGRELDDIRDTAIAVSELIRSVPGAINVTDMTERASPELRIRVDKDAAMANGLTVAQVFMAVNGAITSPEKTINMTLSGTSYEIIVSDGDFEMPDSNGIENLQLATNSGFVTLSDIAEVYEDIGLTSISRRNRVRNVTIDGEIEDGYNVTLVNAEIERLLENFEPAPGCDVFISGEAEAIADAFIDMYLMLALGLVFIYLILVAQFQSLLSPFIIMFTVPLGFTGGFSALLIAGVPLSIVAMIGLILLMGVITNNGILIISRINQMRWQGMSKKDAIIDSGRKRIRPILITAISTIAAMSLMALGFGDGTEMMQPMAIATIGGLSYGTAMTLFFIPVLYDLLNSNKDVTKENLDADE